MSTGVIILVVLQIIVYFGIAEKMLEKMGIKRNELLLLFLAMIIGSFIDLPILAEPVVTLNLGGAVIPVIFAIYILFRNTEREEVYRTIFAVLVTGITIFLLTQIYQFEEGHTVIDTNYLFPLVAGLTAYIAGRSRRSAFIAGVLGFLIYDLIHVYQLIIREIPGTAAIGGAGVFDSIVISGIVAVLVAEIVGELIEYITRKHDFKPKKEAADFEVGDLERDYSEDDNHESEE